MDSFWVSLPATIAAIGAIIATILSHLKSSRQRTAATETATQTVTNAAAGVSIKIDDANSKLDDIKSTTNGTLDAALKRIEVLESLVADLQRMKDRRK